MIEIGRIKEKEETRRHSMKWHDIKADRASSSGDPFCAAYVWININWLDFLQTSLCTGKITGKRCFSPSSAVQVFPHPENSWTIRPLFWELSFKMILRVLWVTMEYFDFGTHWPTPHFSCIYGNTRNLSGDRALVSSEKVCRLMSLWLWICLLAAGGMIWW